MLLLRVSTPKSISVKVLGTSFVVDVKDKTDLIKVSVITGLVQVDEDKTKLGVLVPGERLSTPARTKPFLKKVTSPMKCGNGRITGLSTSTMLP